ncbi:MAG: hypothetical protein WBE00_06500, partial [Phycisphaerae bacterium]
LMARRAARGRPVSAILVVAAFAQLHVAYGLGSLWGVLTAPLKFGLRRDRGRADAIKDRRE